MRKERRHFMQTTALATAAFIAPVPQMLRLNDGAEATDLEVHIFSKHLQFLGYADMADAAAGMGFEGVDLTVRPGGHVLPEHVQEHLPVAVAAVRGAGLKADLMATRVSGADEQQDRAVIQTAAQESIRIYRMDYLDFLPDKHMPELLKTYNARMMRLAAFTRPLGITGTYQNHAGTKVGAQLWDLYHLLRWIEPEALGIQYDIRHGMVEGGMSWINNFRLIVSQINCLVFKDFIWQQVEGRWRVVNVPMGQGMVDWLSYFRLLKQHKINVPVTLHCEYPLGGAEHGRETLSGMSQTEVFEAIKKDLRFIRTTWSEA